MVCLLFCDLIMALHERRGLDRKEKRNARIEDCLLLLLCCCFLPFFDVDVTEVTPSRTSLHDGKNNFQNSYREEKNNQGLDETHS